MDKVAFSWTHANGSKADLGYKDDDLEYVGTHAAEAFHSQHDGWECEWPTKFQFYNKDDEYLGTVEVELEMEPTFHNVEIVDEV